MRNLRVALIALTFLAAAAADGMAQPRSDLIVLETNGNVLRVPAVGPVTTVATVATTGTAFGMTMDVGNEDVVVALNEFFPGGKLVRVNLATGNQTTIISNLGSAFSVTIDQNGDYICDATANMWRVKRDGSSQFGLFQVFFAVSQTQDLLNGDWIVSGASGSQIERYEYDHSRRKSNFASGYSWGKGHDPHRAEIYSLRQSGVIVYDTQTGAVLRTLDATSGVGPGINARSLTVDHAPAGSGALVYATDVTVSTSSHIFALDRRGMNLGTVYTTPNRQALAVRLAERHLTSELVTAPNDRRLHVNFPASAGKRFAVGLSLAGFTSNVPLIDGRVIPITPDDLTTLSLTGRLGPLFTGNIGVLDPNGNAQARFDVNSLGAVVNGVRVWAVAVTIDPATASGIGEISAPIVLVL